MKTTTIYNMIRSVMGLSFHMMFTAAAIYRIDVAQLEPYQLILTGTALEISIFLFEVPTGIVADLKSRRLSVIIGLFIVGIGFIIEGLFPIFFVIFIAQMIWGLGDTFISGALDSWFSDELQNEGIEHAVLRGRQFQKGFAFLGILLAAVIGMVHVRYAIYVSGGLFLFAGVVALIFMKEKYFTKHIHQESMLKEYTGHLAKGIKHIKRHNILRWMFLAILFYGLFSEGIDRTYELNILDGLGFRDAFDIPPIFIIAIVAAIVELAGLFIIGFVKKRLKNSNYTSIWVMNFTLMMMVGILVFTFMPHMYFALFGYLIFSFSREGTYPLLDIILVKNTPSKIKATVLSSFGQLDAIGQLLSGAMMILVTALVGLKGMYVFTALLLIVPVISMFAIRNIKHSHQIEET